MRYRKIKELNKKHVIIKHTLAYQVTIYNHDKQALHILQPTFVIYWENDGAAAKSLQSCPTLCDPTDGSPSGPPVPGILQARTLEWVAISFSSV